MPEPEEKDLTNEPIAAVEQPKVIANTPEGASNMIVVNNNPNLESLISRASRGEVTLVAQAAEDGTYILVENPESLIDDQVKTHCKIFY